MKRLLFLLALLSAPAHACDLGDSLSNTKGVSSPKILAIGSSSTAGVGSGRKRNAYPSQLNDSLMTLFLSPKVVARGVGGEKATGALARLEREIADTRPNLVLWQVGTNDANARLEPEDVAETIREGVRIIRTANADVILIDPQYFPRIARKPHYWEMSAMIDRVGEELCIPVVDRFEDMRDSGETILPRLLAKDRFHMSALGHKRLAQLIHYEIRCALGQDCAGR